MMWHTRRMVCLLLPLDHAESPTRTPRSCCASAIEGARLDVVVDDYDLVSGNDFIGRCVVPLGPLGDKKVWRQYHALLPQEGGNKTQAAAVKPTTPGGTPHAGPAAAAAAAATDATPEEGALGELELLCRWRYSPEVDPDGVIPFACEATADALWQELYAREKRLKKVAKKIDKAALLADVAAKAAANGDGDADEHAKAARDAAAVAAEVRA